MNEQIYVHFDSLEYPYKKVVLCLFILFEAIEFLLSQSKCLTVSKLCTFVCLVMVPELVKCMYACMYR